MKRLLMVDGNWYLHRCFHTYKSSRPIEEGLPHSVLALVLKDAVAVKATHILVALDGHDVFRYTVFPDYKKSRSEKEKGEGEEGYRDVYACLPNLRKLFAEFGITLIQHKKYEADDVWASVATQYPELGFDVVGGGKDKDGFAFLKKGVRLYDSSRKPEPIYIDARRAEKIRGVPVSKMVMLQTLIGDPIDDVPQIVSLARAKKICNEFPSIKAWFEQADRDTKKMLRAKQAQLIINKKLVTLVSNLALPDPELLKPEKQKKVEASKWWYAHQDLCWPKSRGLFRK